MMLSARWREAGRKQAANLGQQRPEISGWRHLVAIAVMGDLVDVDADLAQLRDEFDFFRQGGHAFDDDGLALSCADGPRQTCGPTCPRAARSREKSSGVRAAPPIPGFRAGAAALPDWVYAPSFPVERQIQEQHIHSGLSQQSQLTRRSVFFD